MNAKFNHTGLKGFVNIVESMTGLALGRIRKNFGGDVGLSDLFGGRSRTNNTAIPPILYSTTPVQKMHCHVYVYTNSPTNNIFILDRETLARSGYLKFCLILLVMRTS